MLVARGSDLTGVSSRKRGPPANLDGVIPSGAVFQAERGISRGADMLHARSLGPLEKARAFGMTPSKDYSPLNHGGAGVGLSGGKVGMIWNHHN